MLGMSTTEVIKLVVPLLILQIGLIIFCLFRLKKDKVKYLPKWAWALIIIFGELLGSIVFLIIGRDGEQ